MAVILAEIHAKVGEVLEHDDVVFVCQLTDDAELFVCQADPCRVVRIRVQHAVDVAFREYLLEFLAQLLATVVVDVELLHRDAQNLALELVNRESWVDKEHGVLLLINMSCDHEARKCALH